MSKIRKHIPVLWNLKYSDLRRIHGKKEKAEHQEKYKKQQEGFAIPEITGSSQIIRHNKCNQGRNDKDGNIHPEYMKA